MSAGPPQGPASGAEIRARYRAARARLRAAALLPPASAPARAPTPAAAGDAHGAAEPAALLPPAGAPAPAPAPAAAGDAHGAAEPAAPLPPASVPASAPTVAADGGEEPAAPPRPATFSPWRWRETLEEFNEDLRARFAIGRPRGPQLCELVAAHFGLSSAALMGARGSRRVCDARQIAMYVLRRHLGLGKTEIGKLFHRNHATVFHAVRKVDARMATNTAVADAVATIVARWRELCA